MFRIMYVGWERVPLAGRLVRTVRSVQQRHAMAAVGDDTTGLVV